MVLLTLIHKISCITYKASKDLQYEIDKIVILKSIFMQKFKSLLYYTLPRKKSFKKNERGKNIINILDFFINFFKLN